MQCWGRINIKETKTFSATKPSFSLWGQFANSQEFLSLQQGRLLTAGLEIQGPYALQLWNEVSVLIFKKATSPHSQQHLASKLHDRVYRNMHLHCQQLNPVLWIQYLSIAFCKNMYWSAPGHIAEWKKPARNRNTAVEHPNFLLVKFKRLSASPSKINPWPTYTIALQRYREINHEEGMTFIPQYICDHRKGLKKGEHGS